MHGRRGWLQASRWIVLGLLPLALGPVPRDAVSEAAPPECWGGIDSDGDGILNCDEVDAATDFMGPDADADGVPDALERRWLQLRGFGPRRLVQDEETQANGLVAADLDGDGDVDLAASLERTWGVYWFANDGSGAFGPPSAIESLYSQVRRAADLDGDGDADLIVTRQHALYWYENQDGLGGFGAARLIDGDIDTRGLVDPQDVDGDGDLDVLMSFPFDPPQWWENQDGAGSFGAAQPVGTQDGYAVAVDLDLDDDLDLVVAGGFGGLSVYDNSDGLGSFTLSTVVSTPSDTPDSLVVLDVDGDGNLDLVTASLAAITWYPGAPLGASFGPGQVVSQRDALAPRPLAKADLDGDGDDDLIELDSWADEVSWYENLDGGSLSEGIALDRQGTLPSAFTVADIDGDGDLDFVVAGEFALIPDPPEPPVAGTPLSWLPNPGTDPLVADSDGDGLDDGDEVLTWASDPARTDSDGDGRDDGNEALVLGTDPALADTDGDTLSDGDELDLYGTDPLLADSDGDGLDDAIELQQTQTDPQLPDSDGNGTPDADEDPDADGLTNLAETTLYGSDPWDADSDGDGLPDGEEVTVHGTDPSRADSDGDGLRDDFELAYGFDPLSSGDHALDPDGDGLANLGEQSGGTNPLLADTDGDGLTDGEERHRATTLGFGPARPIGTADPGIGSTLLARDLDGDGDVDLLLYDNALGGLALQDNLDGAGSFGAPVVLAPSVYSVVRDLSTPDLDGDGDPDVLLVSNSAGVVWLENESSPGLPTFAAPRRVVRPSIAKIRFDRSARAADVDRDGDLDLVVASTFPSSLRWYENRDGAGSFGTRFDIDRVPPYQATAAAPADFDGDGRIDLIVGSEDGSTGGFYVGVPGPWPFADPIPVPGLQGAGFLVGDLNGDRRPDLATRYSGLYTVPQSTPVLLAALYDIIGVGDVDCDGDVDVITPGSWSENVDGLGGFVGQLVAGEGEVLRAVGDLDGDGDLDLVLATTAYELAWRPNLGTDPLEPDSDGDGRLDGEEILLGSDPLDPASDAGPPLPARWESDYGIEVALAGEDDLTLTQPLGFSFPFAGQSYGALTIGIDGAVGLALPSGDPLPLGTPDAFLGFAGGPVLAPLLADLDLRARGHVWLNDLGDHAVITWDRAGSELEPLASFRFQLQLFDDGRLVFAYAGLVGSIADDLPGASLVGITPGGVPLPEGDPGPVSFASDAPFSAGTSIYEPLCCGGGAGQGVAGFPLDGGAIVFTPVADTGFDVQVEAVPEPGAGLLAAVALLVVAGLARGRWGWRPTAARD